MKKNSNAFRITQLALLSALSVVVGLFKFPIIPIAPFLEFDFADAIILVGSLSFGLPAGLSMLFAVAVIQAFLLGGNGIIGLIMHFVASSVLLVCTGLIYRHKKSFASLVIGLVVGVLGMTATMIPLNYIFIPILFGASTQDVTNLLLPALIPFNLIKSGGNAALGLVLFKLLTPLMKSLGIGKKEAQQ